MIIDILKCHGSGNDFLLIDELTKNYRFTEADRKRLAQALCKREGLLGADGILFVLRSEKADARMRVFNADGSEASMCGNGLRCVARFVCEKLGKEQLLIETMKADLAVEKTADLYQGIPTFKVEISPVLFNVESLPLSINQKTLINEPLVQLSETLKFTALAVPNPHLVSIVEQDVLDSDVQEKLSQFVNSPNELFPDGVNVSFVKRLETGAIFVRTYERGVGFTNACGTAMSAASLVTCLNGFNETEREISVYNNGGQVKCVVHFHENSKKNWIDLIGNGTYEYKASIVLELNKCEEFKLLHEVRYDKETALYTAFQSEVKTYLQTVL
ncbi:diaminopimelate epimerase [Peribacillus huizhouensis]|uniref:Diaminopimelate epimerase n=1 Tax=Peribacillus huizhouensis TaxID=1501239 RepID=A0ABR6CRV9_9BACI|nr:diaminopimelate epimerase [Peribacillus huizhouensis]MBA9027671.1 diaminopimelate epimerase [Peribacillus huizhouensis]